MKKRIVCALVMCAVLMALCAGTFAAESTEEAELFSANVTYPVEGGLLYFDATSGTIERCDKTVTSAEIPSEIYGITVRHIYYWAFENCTSLANVTIPNSITSIDGSAFRGCTKLTSIIIPSSLTSLSSSLFDGCTSLTDVMIPSSIKSISYWSFDNCPALKNVYYEGTIQQWLSMKIEDGNDSVLAANIHFESEIQTPSSEQVRINSISVYNTSGEPLDAIPTGSFMASVSITSLSSLENALIYFAAYTPEGQYEGLTYAFVEASPGATVKVTIPMENTDGRIGQLKAFATASMSDLTPLGTVAAFGVQG